MKNEIITGTGGEALKEKLKELRENKEIKIHKSSVHAVNLVWTINVHYDNVNPKSITTLKAKKTGTLPAKEKPAKVKAEKKTKKPSKKARKRKQK